MRLTCYSIQAITVRTTVIHDFLSDTELHGPVSGGADLSTTVYQVDARRTKSVEVV